MDFKTHYKHHAPRTYAFKPVGEPMTQQQFKEECDINNILAKFKKTGMISHINKHQGNFGDFSTVEDYKTSLEKVMTAQQSFLALPSELRSKFDNDPAKLIEFIQDEKNREDCYKYGLLVKPAPKEPTFQEQMESALESHAKKQTPSKA